MACACLGLAQNNHSLTGAEYFKYHSYTKAYEEFCKGAQQGDTYSQFFVVFLTYAGVGTPRNVDKAFSLIGKYAQTNDEMCEFAAAFYSGEKWSFTYMGEVLSTDALDVESMRKRNFSKAMRFVDLYEKKHHGDLTEVLSSIKGYCYFMGEGGLPQHYGMAFKYLSEGLRYSNLLSYNDALDEYLRGCNTIESLKESGAELKSMIKDASPEQLKDIDKKIDQGINKLVDNWLVVNKNNLDDAYLNCTPEMKSIIDQRFDANVNQALSGIDPTNLSMAMSNSLERAANSIKTLHDRSNLSLQKQAAKEIWTVLSLWAAYNKTDMNWKNYENVYGSSMFCPDIFTGVATCKTLPSVPNIVDVNLRQIKYAVERSGLKQYDSRSISLLSDLADNKATHDNPFGILSALQERCNVLDNAYPANGHYQLKDLDKSQLHLGEALSDRYYDRSLSTGNIVEYEALVNDYNTCVKTAKGKMMKGDIELLTLLTSTGTSKANMIQNYMHKYPDTPYVDYLNDQYAIDKIEQLDKNSSRSQINSVKRLPMSKSVSELAKKKAKSIALEKRNGYHIVTFGLQGGFQLGVLLFENYEGSGVGYGFSSGLALDLRCTNVFGIRAEGEYMFQAATESRNSYSNLGRKVFLNYINIPVMLTITPNSPIVWDLGAQYGYCLGGWRIDQINYTFEGTESLLPYEYNDRLLSVLAGIRYQEGSWYLGVRATYSLDNILNNNFMIDPSVVEVGNSHIVTVKGFLGYQF